MSWKEYSQGIDSKLAALSVAVILGFRLLTR